ncbi:MAG: hypothetical protein AAFR96_06745 [Planctomycetota bacterium]
MKTTALLGMASLFAVSASSQSVVYFNTFGGAEGDTPEDIVAAQGLEFVGNGDEGAGFFDASRQNVVVQSYGSRQIEVGVASFPLAGVTLEAGTEYTFSLTVTEDEQNWSVASNIRFGLNDAGNRPVTPSALADVTFDTSLNDTTLPLNLDFVAGPLQTITFTYTPAVDEVEPLFVLATSAADLSIFLDARIRLWDITISTGDGSSCGSADIAAPLGTLDFFDVLESVDQVENGCP